MSEDIAAESIVRRFFVFLKESLDFDFEQDALMQEDLLDEKEKEDHIFKDQCKALWCERYLKRLIMKKTCKGFIAFIHNSDRPSVKIISKTISMTQQNPLKSDLTETARVESSYQLTYELLQKHIYFLYTELEPREIADLMFQSDYISCNDHDSITDSHQKYKRFMSLLNILNEKQLYSQFVNTLQDCMKYRSVLETLKEEIEPDVRFCDCDICIQHNFTFLQEELPDADCTTVYMDNLFDKTNRYDIDYCKGKIRKKSKLLKILLMKGSPACMELFKVIEEKLKREKLIPEMKKRSADKKTRGKPDLPEQLKCLRRECLEENEEFLLDELEPIELCDILLEERAIEIMIHDKITETEERRQQAKDLLQVLQENKNECFHYFLHIIQSNEYKDICNQLKNPSASEAVGKEPREQSNLKLEHIVNKLPDNPQNKMMEMRMTFSDNAKRKEEDLYKELKSPDSELLRLTMAHGHMNIENVDSGSVVLRLRPLTDQAVQTLLNAKENNKLFDMIIGMLKNINIADKMSDNEPLEIKVQVYYASPEKGNQVPGNTETGDAEQIKHRIKANRNKLVSDIEPGAIVSVLSKSFPKSDFGSVDQASSSSRKVERLLSLIEKGEPDLVKAFVKVLNKFGYHEILKLIDPQVIHETAKDIREKIAYNFTRILEEMQITFARETLSNCIGDIDGIKQKILPSSGNRRQRMSNFLQFILKEDHNVIEFEKMLKNNGLEKLLKIDKNKQEEHVSSQNIEVIFVKDPKPSSSEILFESVITLSNTGRKSTPNYPNCQEHVTNPCKLFCEQCDTPICDHCALSVKHQTHNLSNIASIIERKKKTFQKDLKELETSLFPKYQEYVDNIPVQKADLINNAKKLTIDLDKQEEDWHRKIDDIIKKQKSELEEMHSKQLAELNKQEEEITHTISEIKHSITDLKDVLKSNDVRIVSAYKPRNEDFRELPPKLSVFLPKINKKQLYQQFGSLVPLPITKEAKSSPIDKSEARVSPLKAFCDLPQMTTTVQTQYEDGGSCQRSVTCHSDDEIWTCRHDNIMRLYNLHGELVKSVQTKSGNMPQDIAVTRGGDLVYTDNKDRTVNIMKNKQIQTVIRLQSWKPLGVCCASSGDLLVVMVSDDDKQTKVVCYSDSTEKQSIQYDDKGRPLFSSGSYICENRNLDICVSDNSARAVVVVNQAGELCFRYTGRSSSSKVSFRPYGITTDSQNRIITADSNNNCIHILDQDGQFLRYIDNCHLQYPWGLCVDSKDNLFVSEYDTGKVKKIQYYV